MSEAPLLRHAFIDIETTGLDPLTDEVIELGLVRVQNGELISRHQWRFRHEKPLSSMIQALTGLPEFTALPCRSLEEAWPEISKLLEGFTVVAHNASFERSFLSSLYQQPMLDSCELTHLLIPTLRSHSLDSLVRWSGVGRGAKHRALDDAEDTFRAVQVALERSKGRSVAKLVAGPTGAVLGAVPERPVSVETPRLTRSERATVGVARAIESEHPIETLIERFLGEGFDVAVPAARLSQLAGQVPRRLADSSHVCRERMLELLELPQFSPMARGYVQRWLEQTPHGERATLSGWMSERWPDVRLLGLLSMADARCRCFQNGFAPNRPAVITHETARRELGQHPVAILEAARFVPREGLLKGWRERECRALCELAAVPFDEAASMAPDAIRGLVAPAGTPPAVAKGLKIAASWLSGELERPEAPAVLMHRLAEARATLVHDVTTLDAGWLEALGLPGLGPPARESVAVHSRVTRVTGVDRALTGIVIGPGTITPELVAAQVTRAPGAVRLGFSNEAPLRMMNWWPGQSTAGIEGQRVTVIGPMRAESLRRLQLALPAQVTEVILLEPPPALTPLPDEPRAQP